MKTEEQLARDLGTLWPDRTGEQQNNIDDAARAHLKYKREIEPLLRELVELRGKTDGEFSYDELNRTVYRDDIEIIVCEKVQFHKDGEFIATAANIAAKLKERVCDV